jgi:hypothetical protein
VPVNPPTSVTEIVLVPMLFCATDTLVGDADNVKLWDTAAVTVNVAEPVALFRSKSWTSLEYR